MSLVPVWFTGSRSQLCEVADQTCSLSTSHSILTLQVCCWIATNYPFIPQLQLFPVTHKYGLSFHRTSTSVPRHTQVCCWTPFIPQLKLSRNTHKCVGGLPFHLASTAVPRNTQVCCWTVLSIRNYNFSGGSIPEKI